MQDYEKLVVWKHAHRIAVNVQRVTARIAHEPKTNDTSPTTVTDTVSELASTLLVPPHPPQHPIRDSDVPARPD